MKKLCFLLALVLLLSGCANTPHVQQATGAVPTSTDNSTHTQHPTQNTENLNAYIPETTPDGKLVLPDFDIPEYNGDLLIPLDPEREVYFLFHQKQDFYTGGYISTSTGYVLTKHPYASEEIQLLVDMQNDITVTVSDLTEYTWSKSGGSRREMQLYHYITMQDGDWKQIAEANRLVKWIGDIHQKTSFLPTSIATQLWELEMTSLSLSWGNSYTHSFNEYCLSETPGFYLYEVTATFSREYIDETVEKVSVMVGQHEYAVDVIWQFHANRKYSGEPGATHMSILNAKKRHFPSLGSPYSNGYIQVQEAIAIQAHKDITITGLQCEMIAGKAVGCRVVISSPAGDMDFYWDMQQPLDISEGSKVTMDLILHSQDYQELWSYHTVQIKLDYEVSGREYSFENQLGIGFGYNGMSSFWDAYLIAFLGVDLGDYYVSYYAEVYEADWLAFLPEDWLQ